jgi:hypothetical protein
MENFKQIWEEALAAGKKAGDEGFDSMYCGFAWVRIIPARGKFVAFCKNQGIGRLAYNKGWQIWSQYPSQSMDKNEAWARAVCDVLKKNSINAYAESRAD